eukprot:TRINITY_DN3002_c0_g1_i2.p1 TRINITY_DN3002_c0_g1~~TRINITY_DN3002_c0_g1_i2.p1  ORF type:complete len:358 (-),score=49.79 TRINITY_DN3002_c0_g1_i2:91-1164(-)
MGDLGEVLLGSPKGRWAANAVQYSNFMLFLPLALLLASKCAQFLFSPGTCVEVFIPPVAAVLWAFAQMRTFSYGLPLQIVAFISIVLVCVVTVYISATHDTPLVAAASPSTWASTWEAKPLALALTVFMFGGVPSYLTAELMSEMAQPEDFKYALLTAAGVTASVFLGVGGIVAANWGWDLPNPVTQAFPENTLGKAGNLCLMLPMMVSYTNGALPMNRVFVTWVKPDLFDSWAPGSCLQFALLTLPSSLFAVSLAILMPDMLELVSLISALSGPQGSLLFPALGTYHYFKYRRSNAEDLALRHPSGEVRPLEREDRPVDSAFVGGAIVLALICLVVAMYGAIASLVDSTSKYKPFC